MWLTFYSISLKQVNHAAPKNSTSASWLSLVSAAFVTTRTTKVTKFFFAVGKRKGFKEEILFFSCLDDQEDGREKSLETRLASAARNFQNGVERSYLSSHDFFEKDIRWCPKTSGTVNKCLARFLLQFDNHSRVVILNQKPLWLAIWKYVRLESTTSERQNIVRQFPNRSGVHGLDEARLVRSTVESSFVSLENK